MTRDEIKRKLSEWNRIEGLLALYRIELSDFEESQGVRATKTDGQPKAPGMSRAGVEAEVIRHMALETRVKEMERRYKESYEFTLSAVDSLPDPHNTIIFLRHVRGLPWRTIMKRVSYSERQVMRLYNAALDMIGNDQRMAVNDS